MSGLLSILRASLLGACLCIAAAQLTQLQSASHGSDAASSSALEHERMHSIQLAPPDASAQWIASASDSATAGHPLPGTPFDSQPLGDLDSSEPDADDGDDFDDALSHAQLGLFCIDFGAAPQRRPVHRAREHVRREDRRCDKPPRSRHV